MLIMIPNINDDDDNDSQYKCKQPFWLETSPFVRRPFILGDRFTEVGALMMMMTMMIMIMIILVIMMIMMIIIMIMLRRDHDEERS